MALKIDPKVVSTIVAAVKSCANGASLNDVMAAFPEPPDRRVAHRWLTALVRVGLLHVDTSSKANRYLVVGDPAHHVDTSRKGTNPASDALPSQVSISTAKASAPGDVDTSGTTSASDVDTLSTGTSPGNAASTRTGAHPVGHSVAPATPQATVREHMDTSPTVPSPGSGSASKRSGHVARTDVSTSPAKKAVERDMDTSNRRRSASAIATPPSPNNVSTSGRDMPLGGTPTNSQVIAGKHVDTSHSGPERHVDTAANDDHKVATDRPRPRSATTRFRVGMASAIAILGAVVWLLSSRPVVDPEPSKAVAAPRPHPVVATPKPAPPPSLTEATAPALPASSTEPAPSLVALPPPTTVAMRPDLPPPPVSVPSPTPVVPNRASGNDTASQRRLSAPTGRQFVVAGAAPATVPSSAPTDSDAAPEPSIAATPPPPRLPLVVSDDPAAYVLVGQWLPLPLNHPQVVDAPDSQQTTEASGPGAELTFDGRNYVPVVSGREVVIAYVGPLPPTGLGSASQPRIELAPERKLPNGTRSATLIRTADHRLTFGATRLAGTIEPVSLRTIGSASEVPATLLRFTTPLPAGHYALLCGTNAYELDVE